MYFLKQGLQYKNYCSDQDLIGAMSRTLFSIHAFHMIVRRVRFFLLSVIGPFLWYSSLARCSVIILLPPFQGDHVAVFLRAVLAHVLLP